MPPGRLPRVALATCADLPALDDDDRLLLDPLSRAGVAAEPAVWDDASVRWEDFDLVVVRSTWDYTGRREAFLAWATGLRRVCNAPALLDWSTDKRYLADLAGAGLAVVPTRALGAPDEVGAEGGRYVVKPTVSAGSRDTARYGPGDADRAARHVERLLQEGRTPILQPYLDAVDGEGETGVVFLGGAYSHAIRKGPMLRPGAAPPDRAVWEEDIRPRDPAPADRALAERVLAWVVGRFGAAPLYARVDLLPAPGGPLVLEVELVEPSLFLATAPGSAGRLADLIAAEARAAL